MLTQETLLLDEPYLSIAKKLDAIEEIPRWKELFKLVRHLERRGRWSKFCDISVLHHVPCYEFVENLAGEIKGLNVNGRIVEVCAGNGKLSYWLRQFGVPAFATDDYSMPLRRDPKYVEKLSHTKALKKYEPELVIGCWMPGEGTEIDVLDFDSVRHYVRIGEGPEGATGDEEIWDRKDVAISYLKSTDPFTMARTYSRLIGFGRGFPTFAALFTKLR